jgi:hypothetical protein
MTKPPIEDQPKIVAESVTETFTVLHCNFALTSLPGQQVSRNEPPEGEDWSLLALEVLEIPGVETVVLRPYGVGIHRAVAFEWDPILAAAERLLYWVGHAFNPNSPDPQPSQPAVPLSQLMPPVHKLPHQDRQ